MCPVVEGKAVDVVCLDFRKAFDTISYSILLKELAAQGLDGCMLCWVKNRQVGWAPRVVGKLPVPVHPSDCCPLVIIQAAAVKLLREAWRLSKGTLGGWGGEWLCRWCFPPSLQWQGGMLSRPGKPG